jgi:hypothetical protein
MVGSVQSTGEGGGERVGSMPQCDFGRSTGAKSTVDSKIPSRVPKVKKNREDVG